MARSFRTPLPDPEPGAAPINPVPMAVALVAVALIAVEAVLSLAARGVIGGPMGTGWRVQAIERFGTNGAVLDHLAAQPALGTRLVSYALIHGGLWHAAFVAALILALGKFVADEAGQARTLAVLLAGTVGGALAYGLFGPTYYPLIGAYPAAYGLIGAFTYLMWVRLGARGDNRLAAFRLIGFLLALQFVFGIGFYLYGRSQAQGRDVPVDMSWLGDLGGFVAGGLVAVALAPGGLAALRDRLRAR